MPEERIFAFAKMMGYLGDDIEEAIAVIDTGFLSHVTPWMVTLIDKPNTLEIREAFKKRIIPSHQIVE